MLMTPASFPTPSCLPVMSFTEQEPVPGLRQCSRVAPRSRQMQWDRGGGEGAQALMWGPSLGQQRNTGSVSPQQVPVHVQLVT